MKGTLEIHEKSSDHVGALLCWDRLRFTKDDVPPVLEFVRPQIESHRYYVRCIAELILHLALSDSALRGHNEDLCSENRGHFLETFDLLCRHDDKLRKSLGSIPNNATYISSKSQNEILNVMASVVRNRIISEVKTNEFYTLMADGTRDLSKKEQLSICVRYEIFDHDNVAHFERFLGYIHLHKQDAANTTQAIVEFLEKYNIDSCKMVSISLDGASVNAGEFTGIAARLRAKHSHVQFVHCFSHRTNLAILQTVKSIPYIGQFFNLLETIYNLFSATKAHEAYMADQGDNLTMKRIIPTRWSQQFAAISALCTSFEHVIKVMSQIADKNSDFNTDQNCLAIGIIAKLKSTEFLFMLSMCNEIYKCTDSLVKQLQSKSLHYGQAMAMVKATITLLNNLQFVVVENGAKSLCEMVHIPWPTESSQCGLPPLKRQKILNVRLSDSYIVEPLNVNSMSLSPIIEYQRRLQEVKDNLISELKARFPENLKCIDSVDPQSELFLNDDMLSEFSRQYCAFIDLPKIKVEVPLLRILLQNNTSWNKNSTLHDLCKLLCQLRESMSEIFCLCKIALTIGVGIPTNERSFSKLKLIKTSLRTTMDNQRLSDLAIISMERDISKVLNLDEVVQAFGSVETRRINFGY